MRRDMTNDIALVAAQVAPVIEQHPEVDLLCLFGSRARGDHNEWSDHDLYAEFDYDKLTWTGYAQLIADLEGALGTSIDLVSGADIARRSPILWSEIDKEGVVLYERKAH
jgi:predicted nucleotidyltransferase